MDAVSPVVLLLLVVALVVAVLMVLAGTGRLPLSMEPPEPFRRPRMPRVRARKVQSEEPPDATE